MIKWTEEANKHARYEKFKTSREIFLEVYRLYTEEQRSIREIREMLFGSRVSRWGVRKILETLGVPYRSRGGRRNYKPCNLNEMEIDLFTYKELSRIKRVSISTIAKWIKEVRDGNT